MIERKPQLEAAEENDGESFDATTEIEIGGEDR